MAGFRHCVPLEQFGTPSELPQHAREDVPVRYREKVPVQQAHQSLWLVKGGLRDQAAVERALCLKGCFSGEEADALEQATVNLHGRWR